MQVAIPRNVEIGYVLVGWDDQNVGLNSFESNSHKRSGFILPDTLLVSVQLQSIKHNLTANKQSFVKFGKI